MSLASLASLARRSRNHAGRQIKPPVTLRARQLADQVIGLIGNNKCGDRMRTNWAGNSAPSAAEQDRTMAVCRMRARWLRQSAAMLAEDQPGDAELARKVEATIEETLRRK